VNSPDEVPNGDTIGRFRNILTRNGLQEKIFAEVVKILVGKGLILKKGTIVDSTFIESPSSTKNREKKRDPEAHSSKKGRPYAFINGVGSDFDFWGIMRCCHRSKCLIFG
jgi:IS5 family transposase